MKKLRLKNLLVGLLMLGSFSSFAQDGLLTPVEIIESKCKHENYKCYQEALKWTLALYSHEFDQKGDLIKIEKTCNRIVDKTSQTHESYGTKCFKNSLSDLAYAGWFDPSRQRLILNTIPENTETSGKFESPRSSTVCKKKGLVLDGYLMACGDVHAFIKENKDIFIVDGEVSGLGIYRPSYNQSTTEPAKPEDPRVRLPTGRGGRYVTFPTMNSDVCRAVGGRFYEDQLICKRWEN